MNELSYLERLALQLALGLSQLPETDLARHRAYLTAAQNADGGFSGREGASDLYYTSFALRSLAVSDGLTTTIAGHAADYLRLHLQEQASVVDLFSLLYTSRLIHAFGGPDVLMETSAEWRDRAAAALAVFRTPDGGYAQAPGSAAGSTYQTFLVTLCHELIERSLPERDHVSSFLASRRREDGGYVEFAPMKRSGTNPTAAAVGALHLLQGNGELKKGGNGDAGVIEFLVSMTSPEGGLRANARAPLADLLSTFTGLWTLQELGGLDRINRAAVRGYLQELALPTGGFRGGLWDSEADVEYTFYGLGVMALLGEDDQ